MSSDAAKLLTSLTSLKNALNARGGLKSEFNASLNSFLIKSTFSLKNLLKLDGLTNSSFSGELNSA